MRDARLKPVALLACITALGLGLRLWMLTQESLWIDELTSWWLANHSGLGAMLRTVADYDTNPPLYYAILYVWVRLFGAAEYSLRTVSVVVGSLSIPLLFVLGRRLFGPTVALLATLLFAVAPFHVYYSQEVRMYALLAILVLGSYVALANLMRAPRSVLWFLLYVASSSFCLYAHYYGLFALFAQGLWVIVTARLRERRFLVAWGAAQGLVALAFLPWVSALIRAGPQHLAADVSVQHFLAYPLLAPYYLSSLGRWYSPVMKDLGGGGFRLFAGSFLAVAASAFAPLRGAKAGLWPERPALQGVSLLATVGLIPILVLASGTAFGAPEYSLRGLVWLVPFLCLLLALGLTRGFDLARTWVRRRALRALGAAAASLVVLPVLGTPLNGLGVLYSRVQHEDWRGAVREVMGNYTEGDLVVFPQAFYHIALDYYGGGHNRMAEWSVQIEGGNIRPGPAIDHYDRFWVLNRAGSDTVERYLESLGATRSLSRRYGLVALSRFDRR